MARNLYAEVTARIVAELEAGAAPWVKPWSTVGVAHGSNIPHNAVTGRPYSGVNVMLLWLAGHADPRFLTYKQATAAGGHVRKGEHGTHIVFVKPIRVQDADDGSERHAAILRDYTVFHVSQCEGLPAALERGAGGTARVRNPDVRDPLADAFLTTTGAAIDEAPRDQACYRPGIDRVELPPFAAFRSADAFYGVAFHELGHWTGAGHRLARDLSGRFGNRRYAAEELIAELTAAFLCAEFGFDGDLRHASYIASWIELLKSDDKAIFTAAAKAQQAADYLRGKALADDTPIAMAA